jgi:hypothetical protein
MAKGYKTGGRRNGTPNKLTRDLREMILGALADAGGRDYLAAQAKKNPGAFLRLLGRLLPTQVTGGDDGDPAEVELSDVEIARRLAFLLARGSHALDGSKAEDLGSPRLASSPREHDRTRRNGSDDTEPCAQNPAPPKAGSGREADRRVAGGTARSFRRGPGDAVRSPGSIPLPNIPNKAEGAVRANASASADHAVVPPDSS